MEGEPHVEAVEMAQGVGHELLTDLHDGLLTDLTCAEYHREEQDTEEPHEAEGHIQPVARTDAKGESVAERADQIARQPEHEPCDHTHLHRLCQGDEHARYQCEDTHQSRPPAHPTVAEAAEQRRRIAEDQEELVDHVRHVARHVTVLGYLSVHVQQVLHAQQSL